MLLKWNKTIVVFGRVDVASQIFFPLKKVALLVPLFKIKTRHKDTKQNNTYKVKVNFKRIQMESEVQSS